MSKLKKQFDVYITGPCDLNELTKKVGQEVIKLENYSRFWWPEFDYSIIRIKSKHISGQAFISVVTVDVEYAQNLNKEQLK